MRLQAEALRDLGRFAYTNKKNLHLYACLMPRFDLKALRCESRYLDRYSGRQLPEMDGFGWFSFDRVAALCTPKMAQVLGSKVGLDDVFALLTDEPSKVANPTSLTAASTAAA